MKGLFGRMKVLFGSGEDEYEEALLNHLKSIGVTAWLQEGEDKKERRVEGGWAVDGRDGGRIVSEKWTDVWVRLHRIHSIEVWSVKQWVTDAAGTTARVRRTEMNYVVMLEPGMNIPPVSAETAMERNSGGKIKSFEWRGLSPLAARLQADKALNNRLSGHLHEVLPPSKSIIHWFDSKIGLTLRIRQLPGNRVGITTVYLLPSLESFSGVLKTPRHT